MVFCELCGFRSVISVLIFLNTKCTKFFTKNTKIQTKAESFSRFIRTIADGRAFNSFVAPLIPLDVPWLRFKADHGSKGTKTEQEDLRLKMSARFGSTFL
jgi:hypothetical protein